MKNYYTFEMACEDRPTIAVNLKENICLKNKICEILAKAGTKGLTPTQLTNTLDRTLHPEYEYDYYSVQKIVSNVRYLIRHGLVKRVEVETGEVVTIENILMTAKYVPADNGWFKKVPAGTQIKKKIPVKKVTYVWVGNID